MSETTPTCQQCNWTNVGCLNISNSGEPDFWMCHGCISRMWESVTPLHARVAELEKELKDAKLYGAYKDETATVFMNQVKDLQSKSATIEQMKEREGKARNSPELRKIAEIVRIHSLYEGAPCHNKRHGDEWVIAHVGHGEDRVNLTLGDCRVIERQFLASATSTEEEGE